MPIVRAETAAKAVVHTSTFNALNAGTEILARSGVAGVARVRCAVLWLKEWPKNFPAIDVSSLSKSAF